MGLIQGRPTRGVIKRFRDVLGRFRGILGLAQGIFGGRSWSKNRLEIDRVAEIFSHAGAAAPDPTLPDSEQLAGAELLHTCAHPRNLAFEMPGNRNGASDRGGRAAPHYGWKGEECPERLRQLQAVDEQLSNDTLADGMDCFKNKKPELVGKYR